MTVFLPLKEEFCSLQGRAYTAVMISDRISSRFDAILHFLGEKLSNLICRFLLTLFYHLQKNIDWGIVTEKDLPEVLVKNIIWVHGDYKEINGVDNQQQSYLWYECFHSSILQFEDYWEIDTERDLITNIKYSKYENSISSGEKVYLSIWRHQYDDSIKTEEFLLCSISHEQISKLYEGLVETQFY